MTWFVVVGMLIIATVGVLSQDTCEQWTEWINDENGGTLDPGSQGDFELLSQLRGPYGICESPTDIECRLADEPHTPYNKTGQNNLQCDVDQGFICFHSSQPIMSDCFNYEIRVLCPCPTVSECTEFSGSKRCDEDVSGSEYEITFRLLTTWRDEFANKTSCYYYTIIKEIAILAEAIFSARNTDPGFLCYTNNTLSANGSYTVDMLRVMLDREATVNDFRREFEEGIERINQNGTFAFKIDGDYDVQVKQVISAFAGSSRTSHDIAVLSFTMAAMWFVLQESPPTE